jgi:ubiquitin-protein ligase
MKRLGKEAEMMAKNPPNLCTAGPIGDNLMQWR